MTVFFFIIVGKNGTFTRASENLYMLIQGLLQKDAAKRIDWLELCLHPFWNDELSHLADSFENVKTSRSILSEISRATSVVSNYDLESIIDCEEEKLSIESDVKNRPKTVPKSNTNQKLHTSSLNIPDCKIDVLSSVQSEKCISNSKPVWQETYKLDRGLAVVDLTEIMNDEDDDDEAEYISDSLIYSKAKTPRTSNISKSPISLDDSVNSANMLGLSEVIPHVGGPNINVLDHLYHPSDLVVTPIAENSKLLKLPVLKWEQNIVGFPVSTIDKLQNGSGDDTKKHITVIFNTYSNIGNKSQDKSGQRQKMHILAYLNTVCKVEEISNVILEEKHHKCLLSDLKAAGQLDLKTRVGN